mmetsp:Transcript_17459/g.41453  ORF Transcript_17459/g.41453 Transcript_17459/m.41453 type:complete len:236 (-) Transcript_17459:17-724(-)
MQQGAEDREALLPGTPNQDLKDQNAHEAQVQEGHQLLLQRLEVAMLSEVASNSHSQCDDNKEADHSQRPQPAKELVVHLRLEVFELRHGPLFFPHLQAAVGFANGAPLTEEHHQMGKVNKEVDARQDCSHQSAQTPWLPEVPPLGGPRQHLLGDLLELCLQPGILRAKLCITPSHLALFDLACCHGRLQQTEGLRLLTAPHNGSGLAGPCEHQGHQQLGHEPAYGLHSGHQSVRR